MRAKQLIGEIHNRSIWQVFAVYLGGAGGMVGWADLLTDRFGVPDWLFTASAVVLVLGLVGILAIKLWPSMPEPSPAARNTVKYAAWYLFLGYAFWSVINQLNQRTIIPEWVYPVALATLLVMLPVVMVVGYFRYRPPGTSDGWVYMRLRPGWAGDWVFDRLVEQGLTVDAALAKIQTAAEQIEQDTGKRPKGPSAKRVQRRRDAEHGDDS